MFVEEANIPAVKIITPARHNDGRGFFSEVYNANTYRKAGLKFDFVQDNHSRSSEAGTLRGLHFQLAPFSQDKLIRVVRGRILDVAVDLRKTSPTFSQYVSVELSADNWKQLLVPIGFAHGFISLEPDTEVLYKVTNVYSREHDRGLIWDDPDVGINWPIPPTGVVLSDKDKGWPRLSDLVGIFA